MAHSSVLDVDSIAVFQQLCADLAQAQSLAVGVARVVAAIERALAPHGCQVVYHSSGKPRLLHGVVPLRPPAPAQLALLNAGEIAITANDDHGVVCYAPLQAAGTLTGWLCLFGPAWSPEHAALLRLIAQQAGPALAFLESTSRQDDRATQLQTLNEIGRLLSGAFDLEQLMEAIHAAVRRIVEVHTFYIALHDSLTSEFELLYLAHEGQRLPAGERWQAAVGLAGVVVKECRPLRVNDYSAECERRGLQPHKLAGQVLGRAWLGLPLMVHDRAIGVMTISSSREDYTYRQEHVDLLMTIAAHAAAALDRAWLYERSERQARQLAVLNRIGRTITSSIDPQQVPGVIMNQVTELFNVEEGSLLLADEATGDMVFAYTTGPIGQRLLGQRLRRGAGIAGYVVETGQSVIVNDVQADERFDRSTDRSTGYTTRTLLATPVRGVGGVQGVIEVLNRRDRRPFTAEDQRLLEALADYAAIALENARQFAQIDQALARRAQELARTNDQLQQNLRSLTALNAFGVAINTTLRSPDEILGMTARGIAEMTGAIGATVLLPHADNLQAAVAIGTVPPFDAHILPLLHRVITTGRPDTVILDQAMPLQADVRAVLMVPLRATQRTLGCVCVAYADALPEPPDRETVVLFASQAAVAVESIELFSAVRTARDQMASILASTREGIMLIGPDASVAVANAALHELVALDEQATYGATIGSFLMRWREAVAYPLEEWERLRRGIDATLAGVEQFVAGELSGNPGQSRYLEWSVLRAQSSGDSRGGVLLVLRDITATKESERLRQDLTHMIVHDLRSPLSSVMASIELMMRGVSGQLNDQQRNVLNIANTSAAQMLEMINTLLDISRLEAGRMPIDRRVGDLRRVIMTATQQLASLAQERGIMIQTEFDAPLPAVYADTGLAVRVVQNLVGNAIKFSGRGGRVTVHAGIAPDGDADMLLVAVSDQGIGIAPKDRDKIFTKFGQVGERRGGTGLGLTFCKLVVEAHGGRIWVESQPGHGSTFFFTIPITTAGAFP